MKTISRYIMTLALLLTAVGGAWAQDTYNVTFKANNKTTTVENVTLPKTFQCSYNNADGDLDLILKELYGWTGDSSETICANWSTPKSSDANKVVAGKNGNDHYITIDNVFEGTVTITGDYIVDLELTQYSLEISIAEPAEPAITVEWNASTKTGYFNMPAYDVEIAPIYAPVAQWAKVEGVDQLPTAIEGIYAESTDAIVKAGTVANIGETENPQGIVMYAVTSTNEAPALTAFSATVPTATEIKTAGDVYVWYYIKGADTPDGQEATAENTFNDSEICTTPLKVTVLTNKFDIQFNAANANTIETGNATVTVGGTAATVTEGKLQGVKMGREVKMTAKEGYKFRKVEVKKKAAGPTTITVTWNGADITGTGGGKSFTKDGVTITADDIEFMDKNFIGGGTFTTTLGNFTKIEVTTDGWYASGTGWSGSTWTGNASSVSFSGEIMGYGGGNLKFVFTIEPTN